MRKIFGSAFALSLCAAAVLAQEVSETANEAQVLDEIAVVGSVGKGSGKVDFMSAGSSSVIESKKAIEERGATQLDEAVKYEAGFIGQPYGADLDTSDWLRLRGFEASVSVDGASAYKGGYFGISPDLYGYESIEVVKGANSLLYGSSYAGGVINLVSKRPTLTPQGEVGAKFGSNHLRGVFFDVSDGFSENVKFRIVSDYEKKRGDINYTWNEHFFIAPSILFLLGDDTQLTLLSSFTHDAGTGSNGFFPYVGTMIPGAQGKILPSANLGALNDSLSRDQISVGYELAHSFNDKLKFESSYKFNRENKDQIGASVEYNMINDTDIAQDLLFVDASVNSHIFDNRISYEDEWGSVKNRLTLGVDYRDIRARGQYFYSYFVGTINVYNPVRTRLTANPALSFSNPNYDLDQSQLGFYLNDKIELFEKLNLTLGVRHDKAKATLNGDKSYDTDETTYQAGILYAFDSGFMPYFNYSESFMPQSGRTSSGDFYKPATARQYEAGVKYLPSFIDGEFSLAYFDIEQRNVPYTDGSSFSSQAGKQVAKGVELGANVNLSENLNLIAAYTHYNEAKINVDGFDYMTPTPLIPKDMLSGFLVYSMDLGGGHGLKMGAGVRYVGKSKSESSAWTSPRHDAVSVPSHTLIDAMAEYSYKDFSLRLNATNIADKEYVAGCNYWCYYGEGAKVTLTAKYSW
ncbi:TonB-dependent siderophore receptor [Campylobacter sp. VBCF_06 NA8]|uniref:TonB-dependent siderophore receptor n=1 Tax=Campylobacter sp. VBCF_06 NA8 TaxID=2983822 RepID=UPI0022E9AD93|nr:TonB-dependent siderophore receptor [Campylobacter sp. VBCF_06 NA8]MDA3046359.1 TonB-dependent siderophore receptor [Campylobacter sp. VBCF_06 NA8]